MKLFMIRHGQSEANLGMRYTGQFDTPLTDLGREQAAALQPVLAPYTFDKVYCSDLQRTADTCANALPGVERELTPLLREYDVGSLVGKSWGEGGNFQPDDPAMRPDYTSFGGENVEMMNARVRTFMQMLESSSYEYVAAFSHFGFMKNMLQLVLGANINRNAVKTENCAIFVFEYDGEKWSLAALNYMKPIP